jgi:hypothetical protein
MPISYPNWSSTYDPSIISVEKLLDRQVHGRAKYCDISFIMSELDNTSLITPEQYVSDNKSYFGESDGGIIIGNIEGIRALRVGTPESAVDKEAVNYLPENRRSISYIIPGDDKLYTFTYHAPREGSAECAKAESGITKMFDNFRLKNKTP